MNCRIQFSKKKNIVWYTTAKFFCIHEWFSFSNTKIAFRNLAWKMFTKNIYDNILLFIYFKISYIKPSICRWKSTFIFILILISGCRALNSFLKEEKYFKFLLELSTKRIKAKSKNVFKRRKGRHYNRREY